MPLTSYLSVPIFDVMDTDGCSDLPHSPIGYSPIGYSRVPLSSLSGGDIMMLVRGSHGAHGCHGCHGARGEHGEHGERENEVPTLHASGADKVQTQSAINSWWWLLAAKQNGDGKQPGPVTASRNYDEDDIADGNEDDSTVDSNRESSRTYLTYLSTLAAAAARCRMQ